VSGYSANAGQAYGGPWFEGSSRQDPSMTSDFSPERLPRVTLAGWVNRHQQDVIDYLVEENRVLHEQLGGQ
jgi:hypothetical protein